MTNQITKSKMKTTVNVEVAIVKEEEYYVAYCPALELSAYGDTIKKAGKAFTEVMNIFLKETSKRGTLEKYLLKNGWKLQQQPVINYVPPKRDISLRFGGAKPNFVHQQIAIPV
jgi:predicted RNase H-like HicB family nuclease